MIGTGHCGSKECSHYEGRSCGNVCECDCVDCGAARRPPEEILRDAARARADIHNDFGDEGELFFELEEALAAEIRRAKARTVHLEVDSAVDVGDASFYTWWRKTIPSGMANDPTAMVVARAAWRAATDVSGNYIADKEKAPRSVTFANGRVVRIVEGGR